MPQCGPQGLAAPTPRHQVLPAALVGLARAYDRCARERGRGHASESAAGAMLPRARQGPCFRERGRGHASESAAGAMLPVQSGRACASPPTGCSCPAGASGGRGRGSAAAASARPRRATCAARCAGRKVHSAIAAACAAASASRRRAAIAPATWNSVSWTGWRVGRARAASACAADMVGFRVG